jgi:hypothetical protein
VHGGSRRRRGMRGAMRREADPGHRGEREDHEGGCSAALPALPLLLAAPAVASWHSHNLGRLT